MNGSRINFPQVTFSSFKKRVFLRTVVFDTEKDKVTFKSAMH